MEQKNKEYTALSQKRYALARCMKYVQLILLIIIVFLPIFRFTSESKLLRVKASSNISVFQYLIGDTETEVKIKGTGKTNSDGYLLGTLLQNASVDVPRELFANNEELFLGFRIAPLIVGLIMGVFSAFGTGAFSKNSITLITMQKMLSKVQSDTETQKIMQEQIENQTYIARVYYKLPKFFEFLEKFLFATTLGTCLVFCAVAISAQDGSSLDWTFHPIYAIISVILVVCLINNIIIYIVCSKDINLIRSGTERFEEAPEAPTINSDLRAIVSLFNGKPAEYTQVHRTVIQPIQTSSSHARSTILEDDKIEILKKYKNLLDMGVITEEEFTAKKAELLNRKD